MKIFTIYIVTFRFIIHRLIYGTKNVSVWGTNYVKMHNNSLSLYFPSVNQFGVLSTFTS